MGKTLRERAGACPFKMAQTYGEVKDIPALGSVRPPFQWYKF
jgi:hypothetical protein